MGRYGRLMAYFIRFSVSRSLEFRVDFFFRIFMDVFYYAVNIAFFKVIFLHTPFLGGWSEPQMMVFAAGFMLMDAVHMTLFTNNQWMLPNYVNRGDLDYYLVRPVSSLFFLSVRDFAINSAFNVLIAGGILMWAVLRLGELSIAKLFLFLGCLAIGTLLHHVLAMFFILPVFWTQSTSGLRQVYWSLARFTERPDGIFRGWARKLFTVFLPMSLVASFPARMYLDPFSWQTFLHLLGVVGAFMVLLVWLWERALRVYSSASS